MKTAILIITLSACAFAERIRTYEIPECNARTVGKQINIFHKGTPKTRVVCDGSTWVTPSIWQFLKSSPPKPELFKLDPIGSVRENCGHVVIERDAPWSELGIVP